MIKALLRAKRIAFQKKMSFGGGYILPPDPGGLILCGQIAKNCNAQVPPSEEQKRRMEQLKKMMSCMHILRI